MPSNSAARRVQVCAGVKAHLAIKLFGCCGQFSATARMCAATLLNHPALQAPVKFDPPDLRARSRRVHDAKRPVFEP